MYVAAAGSYLNRKGNGSESHGEHRFLMPVRCDWGFTNHRLSDSWEVGLRRADRWSALAYATTNGIKDILPGREGHVGGTAPDNRRSPSDVAFATWQNILDPIGRRVSQSAPSVGPPQADLPGVRQSVIRESPIASHRHQKTMFPMRFRSVPLSIQI